MLEKNFCSSILHNLLFKYIKIYWAHNELIISYVPVKLTESNNLVS